MNTKAIPRRYDLVEILQEQRGWMTADALAARMELAPGTLWAYVQLLSKEQLVYRDGKKAATVHLTVAGRAWKREKRDRDQDVPRYKCGHRVVPSTHFCLKCHNTDRWKEYQTLGTRFYLAHTKDGR